MNHKVFILKALVSHQKLLPVYNLFGHKLKFNEFHERKLYHTRKYFHKMYNIQIATPMETL